MLAFSTVAATEENQGFYILSNFLPSLIRRVLLFLAMYWPVGPKKLGVHGETPRCIRVRFEGKWALNRMLIFIYAGRLGES